MQVLYLTVSTSALISGGTPANAPFNVNGQTFFTAYNPYDSGIDADPIDNWLEYPDDWNQGPYLSNPAGGYWIETITAMSFSKPADFDQHPVVNGADKYALAVVGDDFVIPSLAPVVTGINQTTTTHNKIYQASTLFTVTDPAGHSITQYKFWNTGTGGGHFILNGVAQPVDKVLPIPATELSQLQYEVGSGADTLEVQAYDGSSWSAWSSNFTVTGPTDTGPVVTPVSSNITGYQDQTLEVSSLVTYSDPFGAAATEYDVWNTGTGGGRFMLNGMALGTSQDNIITAAQFAQLTYEIGTGTDTLWIEANDGTVWGHWSNAFTVAGKPDLPDLIVPEATVTTPTVTVAGQTVTVSTYVTNNGVAAAQPNEVGLYVSTSPNVTRANGTLIGTNEITFSLQPDQSTTSFQISGQIPDGLAGGTYYVAVIADYNESFQDENYNNDVSQSTPIAIAALPLGADHTYVVAPSASGTTLVTTLNVLQGASPNGVTLYAAVPSGTEAPEGLTGNSGSLYQGSLGGGQNTSFSYSSPALTSPNSSVPFPSETFTVPYYVFYTPTGYDNPIAGPDANITITVSYPEIQLIDATVTRPAPGNTSVLWYNFELTGIDDPTHHAPITIPFHVDGGVGTGVLGVDYENPITTSIDVPNGESTFRIGIVVDGSTTQDVKTVSLSLDTPTNAVVEDASSVGSEEYLGTINPATGFVTVTPQNSPHNIGNGQTETGDTVTANATLNVQKGGAVVDTTVDKNGTLVLQNGASGDPTVVLGGGFEVISSGATDNGALISGGTQTDYGLASGATVFASGTQFVESGGTAEATVVVAGGREVVYAGGTDSGAVVSGGLQIDYGVVSGGTVVSFGTQFIGSGGIDTGATLSSGGKEVVFAGGSAINTTVGAGGTLVLVSGSYASGTVNNGGSVVSAAMPTLGVANDPAAGRGQLISLSSLVTVNDAGSVGYQQLQLWDSNGTVQGGEFLINGASQAANQAINVPSGANVAFEAGTVLGTDTLWAQVIQGNGTATGWQKFTVTVPAPVLGVSSIANATGGQTFSLSSLVTIADPANVGYQTLQLWDSDGTSAGGEFFINGVAQTSGHAINVPSGANVMFDAGSGADTDTLWAQLIQSNGSASGWKQFSVTVPAPTASVTSIANASAGAKISLSQLVTVNDPSNASYTLQLWDSDGTPAGGEFLINGVAQTGGHAISVPSGANVVFDAGSGAGTDTIWAQLIQSNGSASGWQLFTVTMPTPSLTVHNDSAGVAGQSIALSTLVTIADPGHVGYQGLELWDSNGTAATGEFEINGAAQPAGQTIVVSPTNVANTIFVEGTSGSADTLWAQLLLTNGTTIGWQQFSVSAPQPTLSVRSNPSATRGQKLALANLVTIADPGHVGYQALQLWDSDGTTQGGEFVVGGAVQPANTTINVSPANVAGAVFDVGTAGGTDQLWARLVRANGAAGAWTAFSVTAPTDQAPIVTGSKTTLTKSQSLVAASTLFTASDVNGNGIKEYGFMDNGGGGGHFVLNGVAQSANQEIDVTIANLAQLQYQAGTGVDTLEVRASDGTLWSNWSSSFTVTGGADTPPVVTASNAVLSLPTIAASSLFSVFDADGDTITEYALKDLTGNGHFTVNGVAQPANTEIDLTPAQLAQTVYVASSTTDTLEVRANDGTLWGNWTSFGATFSPPLSYTYTNLIPEYNNSSLNVTALGINDSGQVVGYNNNNNSFSFVDTAGAVTLIDVPGSVSTFATGINASGEVVGYYGSGGAHGFTDSGGTITKIADDPLGIDNTYFLGINSSGEIVGDYTGSDNIPHAFVYENGTYTNIGGPSGSYTSTATGINDAGDIVGYYQLTNSSFAQGFLYTAATGFTTIDYPLTGLGSTMLTGINNLNQIVGNVSSSTSSGGFIYEGGEFVALNQLPQGGTAGANGINDTGQIVGSFGGQQGNFTGSPNALTVNSGSTLEIATPYAGDVTFAGATGTFKLDASNTFVGTVSGMTGNDAIDFADINFASIQTPTFSGTSSNGTLSVTDGTHTANIILLGDYLASTFVASSDGHGGTTIVDPAPAAAAQTTVLTQAQHT